MKYTVVALLFISIILSCKQQDKDAVDDKISESAKQSKSIPDIEKRTKILKDISGEWLNSVYIDVLKMTKSPLKAFNSIGDEIPYFAAREIIGKNYELMLIEDFHEGVPVIVDGAEYDSTKNLYFFLFADQPFETLEIFEYEAFRHDEDTLVFINEYDESRNFHKFHRIAHFEKGIQEDLEIYVNKIALAGKYQDQAGKIIQFTDDQLFKAGSREREYSIGLDFLFTDFDYIYFPADPENGLKRKTFAYMWSDDKLYIYKAAENEYGDLKKIEPPLYVLTPMENA